MKIAILTPNKSVYTETFIQNHIKHLPFDKVVVYGGRFPYRADTYKHTMYSRLKFKAFNTIRKIVGLEQKNFVSYSLLKILKYEKVDLVFAEYLFTGAETVAICKSLNIPMVAIALGHEIARYKLIDKYRLKYKELFDYAKCILVVSNHMKVNLKKLGCPMGKVVYTPAGPAAEFFKIMPNFKSNTILAIGRFVDKKAPHLTVLAFKKVLEQVPDAKLVFAGDGELLSVCRDLVKVYKIEASVVFKGRINQSQQCKLLGEATVFVQHSRVADDGDSEGTPVAILEASAASLPIVSTNHAGIPDVVKHGQTGFLVTEQDIDTMSQHIIYLLKHKAEAQALGQAGRMYVKQHFTLEQHIQTISDCILE